MTVTASCGRVLDPATIDPLTLAGIEAGASGHPLKVKILCACGSTCSIPYSLVPADLQRKARVAESMRAVRRYR